MKEKKIVGWYVEGCPTTFPTYQEAEQWRSAQVWDGGIGMTPLPEPVYEKEEE